MARIGREEESVGVDEDDDEEDGKEDEREQFLRNSDGCERWVKFHLKQELFAHKHIPMQFASS